MNTLYFVKRSRRWGILGVTKARTSEKGRIRELLADGYKQVSHDTYRATRFAVALF